MANIVNRVWVNTATTGTGTVTLGSATTNYQTPTAAGMINGASYDYLILDGTSAWEVGTGVYTLSGLTLTRPGPGVDANFSSSTNALISLSGSATIAVVANQNTLAQKITGSGPPGSLSYPFGTVYIDSTNNAAYVSLSSGVAPGIVQVAPINAATNPSGTLICTLPAAPTAGNVLIALYTSFSGATVGGGFTSLGSQGEPNDNLYAAYRVVVGGDAAAQTVGTGATFGAGICAMWEVSGLLTPPFLDVFAGVQNASATTSSQTIAATATANEIALVLSYAYGFGGTVTPDGTWTTDSTFSAATNSRPAWSGHKNFPTAGVTPTQTTTFSAAAVGESVMVSLKAATPGAVWLRMHAVNVQSAGSALGVATTLNFAGAGVTAALAGDVATLTIAGASGGSSGSAPPTLISKHTCGAGETTFTFSSIPATYEDIELVVVARTTAGTVLNPNVTINGLSTAIYDLQRFYFDSGLSSSNDQTLGSTSWNTFPGLADNSQTANMASGWRLRLFDYQNTALFKQGEFFGRQQQDAVTGGSYVIGGVVQAQTTAAITSITITLPSNAFVAGTTFSLFGIGVSQASGLNVPQTTPDLVYLWDVAANNLKASSGYTLMSMTNSCPWNKDFTFYPTTTGAGITVDAATLNSYPVVSAAGVSTARYSANLPSSYIMHNSTVFALVNMASFASSPALLSGNSNSFEFRFDSTGHPQILKAFVAAAGTSTTALSTGTWTQCNATYNDSTGAYAFRVAKAAAGSGTNIQGITAALSGLLYNPASSGEDFNGKLAFLAIYNRVLTAGEIAAIEGYITNTYGV